MLACTRSEVKPPRAAAAVPVAIVSLTDCPVHADGRANRSGLDRLPDRKHQDVSPVDAPPCAGLRAHRRDLAILNQQVRSCIETIGWIDDAAPAQKQRIHSRTMRKRTELTTQARPVYCKPP